MFLFIPDKLQPKATQFKQKNRVSFLIPDVPREEILHQKDKLAYSAWLLFSSGASSLGSMLDLHLILQWTIVKRDAALVLAKDASVQTRSFPCTSPRVSQDPLPRGPSVTVVVCLGRAPREKSYFGISLTPQLLLSVGSLFLRLSFLRHRAHQSHLLLLLAHLRKSWMFQGGRTALKSA